MTPEERSEARRTPLQAMRALRALDAVDVPAEVVSAGETRHVEAMMKSAILARRSARWSAGVGSWAWAVLIAGALAGAAWASPWRLAAQSVPAASSIRSEVDARAVVEAPAAGASVSASVESLPSVPDEAAPGTSGANTRARRGGSQASSTQVSSTLPYENALLAAALGARKRGDFAKAEAILRDLETRYPTSPLLPVVAAERDRLRALEGP